MMTMEQIPGRQQNEHFSPPPPKSPDNEKPPAVPPKPSDITMPHFFAWEGYGESARIEKHYLLPATRRRFEHELKNEREYIARMHSIVKRLAEERLPIAAENLAEYLLSNGKDKDKDCLLKVVHLQNDVIRTLSGLPISESGKGVTTLNRHVRAWLDSNLGRYEAEGYTHLRPEIETMFDGVLSVCEYIGARKKQLGDDVWFGVNDRLDANNSIDLVEVVRDNKNLIVRLVQCGTGGWRGVRKQTDSFSAHKKWVEEDLIGVHDSREHIIELLRAEAKSRGDSLREYVLDDFNKNRRNADEDTTKGWEGNAAELVRIIYDLIEDSQKTPERDTQGSLSDESPEGDQEEAHGNDIPDSLRGESPLSLLVLRLQLLNENEKKWAPYIATLRRLLEETDSPPVLNHPIKSFFYVYVENGKPLEPLKINIEKYDERFFLGTEKRLDV